MVLEEIGNMKKWKWLWNKELWSSRTARAVLKDKKKKRNNELMNELESAEERIGSLEEIT
jgi:hypothetical protein